MREYLFVIVVATIVTYVATPLMRAIALRLNAFTPVRERDVHSVPIPRLGGVALFLGFLSAGLVASRLPYLQQIFDTNEIWGVFAGAAVVCLVGAIDDVHELDPLTKLGGQLLAAGVMAFAGVQFFSLPLGEATVLPAPILVFLTILTVVVMTNAVNFVDGLDGLAAGIVGIAAVSFFAYAYLISRSYSPANVFSSAAFVAAALIGVCLGFLPHNVYPARIFMGDSGALFLGLTFAAATISLTGTVSGADVSTDPVLAVVLPLLVPFAIVILPLLDVLLAVVRRTRAGRKPWQSDAQHLHHQMLRIGHGHRRAVLLLWLWAAVAAFGAVSFVFLPARSAALGVLAAVVLATSLTLLLPRLSVPGHRPAR
ncbi:MAG: MraY family glycosyltransferase [Nostocoides sp.]